MTLKRVLALISLLTAVVNSVEAMRPLPVTGSWINLFYQDERNKYTNPDGIDMTDPDLWRAKVDQMRRMGVEYLVFMAVANEGKADYPSRLMPSAYPADRESPVSAIMDQAARDGMKVFLSIGWAESQDDNLRDPKILNRQLDIMEELAEIYGRSPAFYGWYLPVEDCLGPVLSEHSVKAVNSLVERAKALTPGKKTMISPYGFYCSDFDDPEFARRISALDVDIIAYQDEIGCVREPYPLPRLRENWKRARSIHDANGIEMWANCELFTWEKATNSRSSALVAPAIERVVGQLQAATDAGAERVISFMVGGLLDDNTDSYRLGQPGVAAETACDYRRWLDGGDEALDLLAKGLSGELTNLAYDAGNKLFDNRLGQESPDDKAWLRLDRGVSEFDITPAGASKIYLRFLDCAKKGYAPPYKIALSVDGKLVEIKDVARFANNLHDTWIEGVVMSIPAGAISVKITILADHPVLTDEIFLL